MTADRVLDASAVLAIIRDEPGAGRARVRLARSIVSSVNVAEVATKLVDWGISGPGLGRIVTQLGFEVMPFGPAQAIQTAELRVATRHRGLSLGDRACLALALSTGLPVLTADRAWRGLNLDVEIELIRG